MEKLFSLTERTGIVFSVFMIFVLMVSCEKIQVAEPVATVPVIIPVEPPKVEPPVIIKYTITANAENGNITPKILVVEKGESALFVIEAMNTLVEPNYFEFGDLKTPMKESDTTISLDKISENTKLFVKYKYKDRTIKLTSKNWDLYSFKIENLPLILEDEHTKAISNPTFNFNLDGTRKDSPRSKWKLISKVKKDDTIGFWFDNNVVVEYDIIELTDTKMVLGKFLPDVSLGKMVYVYKTFYAK